MFYFFVIIFLLAFVILAWRKLDLSVMFIIAGLPLYLVRFKVFGVPMTLLEAMILIAFFIWLVFKTRFWDFLRGHYGLKDFLKNSPFARAGSAEGRRKYPFGIEAILLLLISLIAVGAAGFSAGSLGIWKAYFFEPILLYTLILNIFPGKERKIIFSLAIGVFLVSVYAVWQKFTGFGIDNPLWQAEATRRVVSFFGYPNAVGLYLAPIIPILTAFLFLPPKKEFSFRGSVAEYRFGLNFHILVNFFKNISADITISPSIFLKKFPQNLKNLFSKSIRRQTPWEEKIIFPLKKENISALGLSKGFLTFIILLSLSAIVFAGSEGALVGLAVAFIIGGLLGNKKTRLVVLALAVAAVITVSLVPNGLKTVEQKLTLKDFSGQVRRYQWKETLIMLNHGRFYQGAGLDNYQQAITPYHQPGFFYDDGTDPLFHQHTVESAEYRAKTWRPVEIYMYPHNIILNFWSELGLAGMFLFVWIIGKFVVGSWQLAVRSKNNDVRFLALGLLGAMVIIIVHGLVDVPYFKNDLSCLFWILMAILALSDLKEKNKQIENK